MPTPASAARPARIPELLPAVHLASLPSVLLAPTSLPRTCPLPHEFTFRFNRRRSRSRGLLFYRVLELAAGHDPTAPTHHPHTPTPPHPPTTNSP